MGLKKVLSILLLTFLAGTAFVNAQTLVKAKLKADEYNVGDLIEVNINLSENPGLHGIYFDLEYDSSVFEFEDIVKAKVIKNEIEENELLYAFSEKDNSHIIVSYTLKGSNKITFDNGNVVKVWFRVKNQGISGEEYKFSFNNCGIIDGNGDEITGVVWNDSSAFSIKSPYTGTFVLIKEPYEYEVFYKDQVNVNLICSVGNFKVKLSNYDDPSFNVVTKDVTTGVLLNEQVTLTYGFNRIIARLFDENDNLLCKDSVKVYRSTDDKFVKIVSPPDHSLLNTDMVEVVVHSPYDNVLVNGINADYYGETVTDTHAKVYKTRLWLREGFNKITATAKSDDNVTYKDEIDVYYQKDTKIFNFILPRQGESFKPTEDAKLVIKGEIDSLYKSADDPALGGPVENRVTLKVIYNPSSKVESSRILVNNQPAVIAESDFGYESARSKYVFYNDFDIPLNDLDDGEIEIIAYKNKEGDSWDNEIHRIVYIDNNRLWIDLVQPNVFTSDLLDTYQKIKDFNESNDISSDGNIDVNNGGGFVLKTTERAVSDTLL